MPTAKIATDLAVMPSPDPCPEAMRALELRLVDYLPSEQILKVRQAYVVGARAQHRQSPN